MITVILSTPPSVKKKMVHEVSSAFQSLNIQALIFRNVILIFVRNLGKHSLEFDIVMVECIFSFIKVLYHETSIRPIY